MAKKQKAAVVVVGLLILAGVYWWYAEYYSRPNDALSASGTIEVTSVEINSKVSGTIKTLTLQAGDPVTEGQLVAEISRNDLAAQRERDAMALMKAEAQLKDLLSGARKPELEEAAANVNIVKVTYAKAEEDLARRETLYEAGAISEQELEQFQNNLELEKNRLQAAEARLSLLEAGSREQTIAAAKAEVQRNKAVLQASETMLEDLKIFSPITGSVVSKNYYPGEFVQMGASLATVADLNDLWIKVYIPTDDLPAVKLGQKVEFTVSGESTVFEGTVSEIAAKGEFTPKSIQTKQERANIVFGVKIKTDSQAGILKPGMPADVTFPE